MHPAPSIIAFTTLSGLGFGLMFWLGIGMPGSTGLVAFVFFAIAYALAGPRGALPWLGEWMPGILSHRGASVDRLVGQL